MLLLNSSIFNIYTPSSNIKVNPIHININVILLSFENFFSNIPAISPYNRKH